ncbi:unnamed protein product [Trifolium pratense]|uniref:Uncharacterized protein n=1 Tax=Trifolium pratense TaxID=57577 RepID=A0ACB0MDK4_TRIPR|nr:unnamed protein product [Trifolium pratense]
MDFFTMKRKKLQSLASELEKKGRLEDVSYSNRLVSQESIVGKISDIVNAIGIIVLAFRGHNVVLEIQGTLPSNFRETSKEPMPDFGHMETRSRIVNGILTIPQTTSNKVLNGCNPCYGGTSLFE